MPITIFMNIPKCGNSTVRDKIIQKYMKSGRLLKIYYDSHS